MLHVHAQDLSAMGAVVNKFDLSSNYWFLFKTDKKKNYLSCMVVVAWSMIFDNLSNKHVLITKNI